METDPEVAQQVNVKPAAAAARTTSFAIRGLAGPYCVMAQNFARGTTAADVESAFTPIGGPMESCRLIKEEPFILIEMMFSSREGGDRVIETFNNKQVKHHNPPISCPVTYDSQTEGGREGKETLTFSAGRWQDPQSVGITRRARA